jgi:hypothetical protein
MTLMQNTLMSGKRPAGDAVTQQPITSQGLATTTSNPQVL